MKTRNIIFIALLLFPFVARANYLTYKQSALFAKDTVSSDMKFLDYEGNIDSLVSTLYAPSPGSDNPLVVSETDSSNIYEDHPDTFYISRLKKIPSAIPLTYNNIVKRHIEVYTIKKRDKLEEILALKEYYFPMFEEVLDKYDLPLELKYLAVIESALNPRAVSRCGATGLWQFMYGTGRFYKLKINSFVDERRDPVAATYAAAEYLKDLYTAYNDWILVIAAYNCGPGNVNKAIRRSGGKTNYWDIYYYLPRETRGYVPAFIAAAYAINYYKDHNLTPQPMERPFPLCDTIMLHENIHIQQIADVLKLPAQLIRDLNPQYRRDIVPGKFGASSLLLPARFAPEFIDLKDSIVNYKNEEFLAGDFKVMTPLNSRYGGYTPYPPSGNSAKIYHKIRSGETLGALADLYHVRVADLRYWNNIRGNNIIAGKNLVVYVPKKNTAPKGSVTHRPGAVKKEADGDYVYYEVKSGDTIWKIASLYEGVTGDDLMKWNNLSEGDKIHPGQTIKIKKM